jgi:hypothetical protein
MLAGGEPLFINGVSTPARPVAELVVMGIRMPLFYTLNTTLGSGIQRFRRGLNLLLPGDDDFPGPAVRFPRVVAAALFATLFNVREHVLHHFAGIVLPADWPLARPLDDFDGHRRVRL